MNKVFIVVLVFVVVVGAGLGVYYFSAQKTYAPIVPVNNNQVIPEPTTTQPIASTTKPTAQVMDIAIKNFAFNPAELQVKVGTEVKWTNQDSMSHTIASAEFQSGQISNGQTYSHVFSTVGNYDYHCSIHPSMTGKIIVNP